MTPRIAFPERVSGETIPCMTLSRRALLSGAGGILVLGGGGLGLVEAGVLPGRTRVNTAMGWEGKAGTVPDITSGPVVSATFQSAARNRQVGYSIITPRGVSPRLPVAVVMHGRGGDHTSAVNELHYDKFLAEAVASGVPPFALVSVDGGDGYWHARTSGDDPARMVREELLPLLPTHNLLVDRIGIIGWSMGGYGGLLYAETVGASHVVAVAAASPAIFASYAASSDVAFDSAADFDAHNVVEQAGALNGVALHITCGNDDPFAGMARKIRDAVKPTPAGGMSAGLHDDAFWTRVAQGQLAFLGKALAAG